ncbi:MAG TPA: thiamine phosphate synthase [Alphaproteobacteria bacterium]|nr:thiamine phosphate synthase [Alphaproteobacteria bacterium]
MNCQLYLISPPHFNLDEFQIRLEEALSAEHIPVFQLRMKTKDENGFYINPPIESELVEAARILLPICRKYNTAFILNDNPKLAKQLGCDGVHLGSENMSVRDARKICGENFIIGASCYASKDLAYEAAEQSANYVAFGQFYETKTKEAKGRPTLDLLKFWSTYTTLPCVAIGGIKVDNAKPIADAGADLIAVVTGVWDYEKGPAEAVKGFVRVIS